MSPLLFSSSLLYKQRLTPLFYTVLCRSRVRQIEEHISAVETAYRGSKSVLHISILEAHIEAANSVVETAYRGSKSVLHISILEAHIEVANSAVEAAYRGAYQ